MAEDIKSLTKKIVDLEKRLKVAESKVKVLADSMTSAKDIDKLLEIHQKKMSKDQELSAKDLTREIELSDKLREAERKERDKEYEKMRKEMDKMNKTLVQEAELKVIKSRLATVEALVQAALKK